MTTLDEKWENRKMEMQGYVVAKPSDISSSEKEKQIPEQFAVLENEIGNIRVSLDELEKRLTNGGVMASVPQKDYADTPGNFLVPVAERLRNISKACKLIVADIHRIMDMLEL
jgi:hypothetical protein